MYFFFFGPFGNHFKIKLTIRGSILNLKFVSISELKLLW
jgi:hypothetical protein